MCAFFAVHSRVLNSNFLGKSHTDLFDVSLYWCCKYRRIPKISPGAYILQKPFLRGLSSEGNLRFKIVWANLIAQSKFIVFALFYFVFEGNFPSTSPQGAYIWRGYLTEGFLRYPFGGLIFGGTYTWRGLFSEFYGISVNEQSLRNVHLST